MKRIKIGDIIPILTAKGIAYAQYTQKNAEYGTMLAVFEGFYPENFQDWKSLTNNIPQFNAFIALQSAINAGLFAVIANEPVAPCNEKFPMFKTRNSFSSVPAWLWDGEKYIPNDRELTDLEKKYSYTSIISAPLLVERIENDYRPETASY